MVSLGQVGGKGAVSSTVKTTRDSVRTLQRRGSDIIVEIGVSSRKGKTRSTRGGTARFSSTRGWPRASNLGVSGVRTGYENEEIYAGTRSPRIAPETGAASTNNVSVGEDRRGAADARTSSREHLPRSVSSTSSRTIPTWCETSSSASFLRERSLKSTVDLPPEIGTINCPRLEEDEHDHESLSGSRGKLIPLLRPTTALSSGEATHDPGKEEISDGEPTHDPGKEEISDGEPTNKAEDVQGSAERNDAVRTTRTTTATRVGEVLLRLPLSKLKIVIGERKLV